MKLVELHWNPTNRQLRQFAIICLFALPLAGWLWEASGQVTGFLAIVGFILAIAGVTVPKIVTPVFLALTIVTRPIGMVVGELAMLLIYFGVLLPIGVVFCLVNHDALQLRLDRNKGTYWQVKRRPTSLASYYHQW